MGGSTIMDVVSFWLRRGGGVPTGRSGTDVPQKPCSQPRNRLRLLVLFNVRLQSSVPLTEYVAAPQAWALPHSLSCATDEHP
jgi:hypothetical protein